MRISFLATGMLLAVAAVTVEWAQRSEDVRAATVAVDANASPAFLPPDITIAVGDMVQWTVSGGAHNVTSVDTPALFTGSGTLNLSDTYSVQFNTAGQFTYYCTFHAGPTQYPGGMTGRITVQAAATVTLTATNTAAAATSTPTRTPTRTATRTATGTPQATETPFIEPTATATPSAITPPQPAGGAAPSLIGPATGDGSSSPGSGSSHAMSIALAVMGGALIAGALAVRRRA